jgi:foldase protein PrsA
VVFSIPVGAVSGGVETDYGFHVIKVLERESAGRKSLVEVMGEIETKLLGEAMEKRYTAWIAELMGTYPVKVDYALLEKMGTPDAKH